jgi:hypothetical protein
MSYIQRPLMTLSAVMVPHTCHYAVPVQKGPDWHYVPRSTHPHTCHYTVPVQKGPDWPYVPRSTHPQLPLHYTCPEADQHTPTHRSTASHLDRLTSKLLTSKILTGPLLPITTQKSVRLINVKLFEISKSSWLNLRIVLVYLFQYI